MNPCRRYPGRWWADRWRCISGKGTPACYRPGRLLPHRRYSRIWSPRHTCCPDHVRSRLPSGATGRRPGSRGNPRRISVSSKGENCLPPEKSGGRIKLFSQVPPRNRSRACTPDAVSGCPARTMGRAFIPFRAVSHFPFPRSSSVLSLSFPGKYRPDCRKPCQGTVGNRQVRSINPRFPGIDPDDRYPPTASETFT